MNTEIILEGSGGTGATAVASGSKAAGGRGGRFPLYLRVVMGVVGGVVLGLVFGREPVVWGLGNDDLGQLGMLVIRLLKALAVPLVLFAILDALVGMRVEGRQVGRLIGICLINVGVALAIGLTLMNLVRPGERWRGEVAALGTQVGAESGALGQGQGTLEPSARASLNPLKNLAGLVPKSLLDPFLENNVITVVLAGVLGGLALRRVKERRQSAGHSGFEVVEGAIGVGYQALVQMLAWVVQAVPLAVFGVVAQTVGRSGLAVFGKLWLFVAVILGGLAIHGLVYYPLMAWWRGGRSPRVFLGRGADAVLMALSTNSSLATVPVTLRCLTERLGVSDASARLSACVGTNLNNDGITLYEAMAALFLAQAWGLELSLAQQVMVVLASLMAGIGVAGVPEAGLIVLPLVLSAAGLPESVIAAAIPLVLAVDWLIARARSAVNVLSDLLVAVLLDRSTAPANPR